MLTIKLQYQLMREENYKYLVTSRTLTVGFFKMLEFLH